MKFIAQGPFRENIYNLMRKAGYCFLGGDGEESELAFARPPRSYPRFHLFIKVEGKNLILNLHLDQKKPSYKGARAHSGEYDSQVLENEAERIKTILK